MAENIKSRKYYRMYNGTEWDRMHFVTDANSVDANDGDTMETKVGAIKGITTSTSVTEEGYAADATVVAALNESLGGVQLGIDGEGNRGYFGADDSFIPFKSKPLLNILYSNTYGKSESDGSFSFSYNFTKKVTALIVISASVKGSSTSSNTINVTANGTTISQKVKSNKSCGANGYVSNTLYVGELSANTGNSVKMDCSFNVGGWTTNSGGSGNIYILEC